MGKSPKTRGFRACKTYSDTLSVLMDLLLATGDRVALLLHSLYVT